MGLSVHFGIPTLIGAGIGATVGCALAFAGTVAQDFFSWGGISDVVDQPTRKDYLTNCLKGGGVFAAIGAAVGTVISQ